MTAQQKFLIFKLNHLGDALLMTPALRLLRKNFPESQIDVVVRQGGELVLDANSDISRLYVVGKDSFLPLLAQRYDYAFDLSNSDRSRFWMLLSLSKNRCANNAYGELLWKQIFYNQISDFKWGKEHQALKDIRTITDILKIPVEEHPLVLNLNVDDNIILNKLSFLKDISPYVVIHPTSRWPFKQWLPDRWAAVADELKKKHRLNVLFSCGPDPSETDHVRYILSLAKEKHYPVDGKLSLRQLGRIIQQSKLFIGVDTVAMHIAAAAQTPVVALFGPSSEWSWRPWKCRHELALGNCLCKKTRKFVCDKSRPYPCMEAISVDEVLSKAKLLL